MNKIYQIKWSKVRNCWCVCSELGRKNTKKKVQGVISRCCSAMFINGLC